jgi:hypothetical protein
MYRQIFSQPVASPELISSFQDNLCCLDQSHNYLIWLFTVTAADCLTRTGHVFVQLVNDAQIKLRRTLYSLSFYQAIRQTYSAQSFQDYDWWWQKLLWLQIVSTDCANQRHVTKSISLLVKSVIIVSTHPAAVAVATATASLTNWSGTGQYARYNWGQCQFVCALGRAVHRTWNYN